MRISKLVIALVSIAVLYACAAVGPRKVYEPFVADASIPSAEVEFWVHKFRNSASIHIGIANLSEEGDELNIRRFGSLTNIGVGIGNPDIKELAVAFPADRSYALFIDNTSSSGFVTTNCSGTADISLVAGRSYRIEIVNWKPKDATFASFSCELDIQEQLPDGTNKQIDYFVLD